MNNEKFQLKWNLDLTKGRGTDKICSLWRGFVISRFALIEVLLYHLQTKEQQKLLYIVVTIRLLIG